MRYSSLHNCEHFVIRELLSYPGETKRQLVFSFFGSETKQLGWILEETISEVKRMGQMELKISLITFKEKEISFHFSKTDYMS